MPYLGLGSKSWRDSGHCLPAGSAQPYTLENAAISRPSPPCLGAGLVTPRASHPQSRGKAEALGGRTKRKRGNEPRVYNPSLFHFSFVLEHCTVRYRGLWPHVALMCDSPELRYWILKTYMKEVCKLSH